MALRSDLARLGVDLMDHLVPFQCSARASFPFKWFLASGLWLVTSFQFDPFQCSMMVDSNAEGAVNPTAHTLLLEIAATLSSCSRSFVPTFGVVLIDHAVPFQCSARVR